MNSPPDSAMPRRAGTATNERGSPETVDPRNARLGDLCTMDCRAVSTDEISVAHLPFVGLENVGSGTGVLDLDAGSRVGNRKSTAFLFDERHVLYGKLGPYLNKVATPEFAGCCSTELVPLLPKEGVDRDFLAHVLRRNETVAFAMASVTGTRMPRADMKILMSMRTPFPPLDEQRRIAGVLNRSTRIERLIAEAAGRVREVAPILFIEMFGDPSENPMGWPMRSFSDLVKDSTKKATKIQKRDYREYGGVQIVDQGKTRVAGYTNETKGMYSEPLPAVVFGDHTRRFKMVRDPFFLGADGAKLLVPRTNDVDPVFLYGQFLCLEVEDAGYSRHFKFLKAMNLMAPPVDKQKRFRQLLDKAERIEDGVEKAGEIALNLRASLMARLLEQRR